MVIKNTTTRQDSMTNFEKITSRKNPGIIQAASLCDKKNRDGLGLFAFEGIKLLREALDAGILIDKIYFTYTALQKYESEIEAADKKGAALFCVTDEVYDRLSGEKNPEGIYTVAKKFEISKSISPDDGYLILEDLQNPSNVGTVIRTASALGIYKILLTSACADIFGPKTLRAAMGTVFRVKIFVTDDLASDIKRLTDGGSHVYAAALAKDACDIRSVHFSVSDSIVLGNEGNGITEKTLALCDKKVIIPMQNGTESLNAAAAAAIFMWEKQKGLID